MVALTVAVVAVVATAGAASPAVLAGVQAGAGIGATVGTGGVVGVAAGSAATGTLVCGATAVGGAAGAIGGSVAAGTVVAAVAGAAGGAVSGAIAGTAVSSIGAGILTGPIGWIVLGALETQSPAVYTFDCWKQILHDESCELSNGKTLNEIVKDPRIKEVTTVSNHDSELPHLMLQNVWDEQFRIEYVHLPSNQLAAHAVKIWRYIASCSFEIDSVVIFTKFVILNRKLYFFSMTSCHVCLCICLFIFLPLRNFLQIFFLSLAYSR